MDLATDQMRAMIYLGINGGFGPADCGQLVWSTIDFENSWIFYPRPKTGIAREVPLWDETLDALQTQTNNNGLAFLAPFGNAWSGNSLAHAFRRLTVEADCCRESVGFYALRHTFATIASATLDQPAIDMIMGHCDPSMSAVYRQTIEGERLIRVVEFVREKILES